MKGKGKSKVIRQVRRMQIWTRRHIPPGLRLLIGLLLMVAGPLLLVILFYALLWQPLDRRVETLQQRVVEQQSLLQWMQMSAQQVKQAARQSRSGGNVTKQSLLALVDRTVRKSGLSRALKRVEPDGADKVKVRLEQASFDVMVTWLETLQNLYGVTVQGITVDRQDNIGVVNVRLTLLGGGQ